MSITRRGIPIRFYILTALTGLGASICFFGLFQQFILFFGSHIVSASTILVSGFLCMALGSYMAGKLANKTKHLMVYFIAFQVLPGVFNLFQPIIFEWITRLFHAVNQARNPGAFRIEMLRMLFSFALLLLPMSLLAGSLPLLIRHFIKYVGHSGRYMSVVILSGSTGTIAGLLIILFLLIPALGFQSIFLFVALINLSTAFLAFIYRYRYRSIPHHMNISAKSEQAKRASMRFKKKKTILET